MNPAHVIDSSILACPMCLSGASGSTLMAANTAIMLMLVVLFSVLASFLSFIFYLAKRSRRYSAEDANADTSKP